MSCTLPSIFLNVSHLTRRNVPLGNFSLDLSRTADLFNVPVARDCGRLFVSLFFLPRWAIVFGLYERSFAQAIPFQFVQPTY